MEQFRPKIVRISVFSLLIATFLGIVLVFSIPSPPDVTSSGSVAIKMLIFVFLQLPMVVLTLVLTTFAYRRSNKARIALGIVYSLVFLVTAWSSGRAGTGVDPLS